MKMVRILFITLAFCITSWAFGNLQERGNDPSEKNTFLSSATSGKVSSILRDILNQESLVRFSMVQKIQNLVMDAIDNNNNTEILKKKLVHLAKELTALEAKDQRLEQDNVKLQQELIVIYDKLSDSQNHTLAKIQKLNETEIYFLKRQFSALQRENEKIREHQNLTLANIQKLNESEIYLLKRQLQNIKKENEELKVGMSKIKEHVKVNGSTLRNETFALKEQFATLSKEQDVFKKKIHQMFEERFSNLTISVDKALDDIRKEQNATNTLLDFSSFQSGNDAIHKLTTAYSNSLYIKLESTQKKSYEVQYSLFSISNETNGYRLSLGQKSGNIDDVFRRHTLVNLPFSTFDHDRNRCAALCGSGWWYNNCALVNLNAPFVGGHRDPVWFGVISSGSDLFFSEMMIKRNH